MALHPRTEAAERPRVRKTVGIGIGALIGWPSLAWCWWQVVQDGDAPTRTMAAVPVIVAAVTVFVTTWWVRHNQGIYRRKGERRAVMVAPYPYLTDRRGRTLSFDPTQARVAREVVIDVAADGTKRYRVVS